VLSRFFPPQLLRLLFDAVGHNPVLRRMYLLSILVACFFNSHFDIRSVTVMTELRAWLPLRIRYLYLFSRPSKSAVAFTQPATQWYRVGGRGLGVCRSEADPPPSTAEVRNEWNHASFPLTRSWTAFLSPSSYA